VKRQGRSGGCPVLLFYRSSGCGAGDIAFFSSGFSATTASVVSNRPATDTFGPFLEENFAATDVLSLKVFTRIGTDGAGAFCGGHSNAVGLRLYFDAVSRPSRFGAMF
jgi:hypothetical protein